MNLTTYKIILASHSPRRRELLAGLDIPFEVRTFGEVNEVYPPDLQGEAIPLYLAELKAEAALPHLTDDELIITADTIVWLDGQVLGKPADEADARRMLRTLSGHTHEVFTGVCLATKNKRYSFVAVSQVTFSALEEAEIDYYLFTYKPYDKAGSYGVQEWIGYVSVERIEGSYYNVMGLPIHRLYKELKQF